MKRISVIMTLCGVFLIPAMMVGGASKRGQPVENSRTLETKEQALDYALLYTGFDNTPGFEKTSIDEPAMIISSTNSTPFVAKHINNQSVWRVHFRSIRVGARDPKLDRDFDVLLEPTTGQLLEILSISDLAGSNDTLPEPDPDSAEMRFQKGRIVFNGLTRNSPPISFIEALATVPADPAATKVIKAIYIDYSRGGERDSATWIIMFRGMAQPLELHGIAKREVPVNQRNSIWCAVDAGTGRPEYCTNGPINLEEIRRQRDKQK